MSIELTGQENNVPQTIEEVFEDIDLGEDESYTEETDQFTAVALDVSTETNETQSGKGNITLLIVALLEKRSKLVLCV